MGFLDRGFDFKYFREENLMVRFLEKKVVFIEGGMDFLVFNSGMVVISVLYIFIFKVGEEVVFFMEGYGMMI